MASPSTPGFPPEKWSVLRVRISAIEALRSLIDRVLVIPGAKNKNVQLEVHGDLAYILRLFEDNQTKEKPSETDIPEGLLSMVAGA